MAKLQLAMDTLSLDEALCILDKIKDYIDIVEIGTPFIYRSGINAIREIRKRFPDVYILCDGKIMDAGAYESREQYEAGADCVTVLAVTDDATIRACVKVARELNKDLSVDTICVNDLSRRTKEIEEMGANIISVHTGVDQQAIGRTSLDDLKEVKRSAGNIQVSVAGGINIATVDDYLKYNPDVIIVGEGILNQKDSIAAAKELHDRIVNYN